MSLEATVARLQSDVAFLCSDNMRLRTLAAEQDQLIEEQGVLLLENNRLAKASVDVCAPLHGRVVIVEAAQQETDSAVTMAGGMVGGCMTAIVCGVTGPAVILAGIAGGSIAFVVTKVVEQCRK